MAVVKLFLPLILLFAFGCQKREACEHKSELRLALIKDPLTLDPRKNSDPISCQVITLLFEGLMRLNEEGVPVPALANSYTISEDRLQYTFKLKNARWSDGKKITSHDFVYSWQTLLSPTFPGLNAYFLYYIKNAEKAKKGLEDLDDIGVESIDDETLLITLERPCPYFLKTLTFCTLFPVPKHILEKNINAFHCKSSQLVCSGSFLLDSWQTNNQIVLRKNPKYWDQSQVQISTISFSILPDAHTRLQLFQKKKLDFLGGFTNPIPLDATSNIKKTSQFYTQDIAGTECCFFNTQTFPFNNSNIRKAFFYAIDRSHIANYLAPSRLTPAYALVPPVLKESNSKILPEGSKELSQKYLKEGLKELGIKKEDLNHLTFSYFNADLNKLIAQELQQSWHKNLGVKINTECLDIKIFLSKINQKNFHFCLMSILAQYSDPYNYLERFANADSSKNYPSFENVKYQSLLFILNECSDPISRLKLVAKAESLLLSDLPLGPLFHLSNNYLIQSHMSLPIISPTALIDFSRVQLN